jgi:hypothetical protein
VEAIFGNVPMCPSPSQVRLPAACQRVDAIRYGPCVPVLILMTQVSTRAIERRVVSTLHNTAPDLTDLYAGVQSRSILSGLLYSAGTSTPFGVQYPNVVVSWPTGISDTGVIVANAFTVPEPSAVLLIPVGLLILSIRAKFRVR